MRAARLVADDIITETLFVKGTDVSSFVTQADAWERYSTDMKDMRSEREKMAQELQALKAEFNQLRTLVNWSADTLETLALSSETAH
jgi:prefoldin subunit 5